jgi:membrane-associated protease RseP (regulator of RpoE activity)|tara:strand:+ start:5644 stop:7083 length:1440 start_codon:yes stop_codon:yes gene_type:complete
MSFLNFIQDNIYDLTFLVLFIIFVFVFLRTGKKNIKREGLLLLYKASWGIRLIDRIGTKAPKLFHVMSYISIAVGYFLMVAMIYLLGRIVYLHTIPSFVQTIKIPPLLPLFPYLTEIPSLSFLPPFYFTYWIIIIAIIAITHEFAHGIFAAHNKVKIKSTGFGFFPWFLPIFLAAFVEQDEKTMEKKSTFGQLAILSAGTFANVLTAILFFGILWLFFILAFTQSGVIFDTYPYAIVEVSSIAMINGISLDNPTYEKILSLSNDEGFNKIKINGQDFITEKSFLEQQKNDEGSLILYYDAPAINAELESVILKINDVKINDVDKLRTELERYSPGDKVTLNVIGKDNGDYDRDIVLGENPVDETKAWLGVGFSNRVRSGFMGAIYSKLSFKEPYIYYQPNFGASEFIYDLLWWIILISASVALINMLPVGIFDGGRFFYLTVLAITGKEKIAKKLFAFSTYFILFVFLILMLLWAFLFF